MQTVSRKSKSYGHEIRTTAPLGLMGKEGEYFLRLSTYKSGGFIKTFASVFLNGDGFETTRIFKDYGKSMPVTEKLTRSTAKNVEKIHSDTLKNYDSIFQEAVTHTLPIVE